MKHEHLSDLGDIDPAHVDVAVAPKPKQRARRKVQQMPKLLEPWAAKAEARMARRPASPGIMIEPGTGQGDVVYASPHDNDAVWQIQLHDAFGTRSKSTVQVFIHQLRALCGQHWNREHEEWRPSETELNAALNFVNSLQPRNEAEAALAAQMVAIHLMTMRVSAQVLGAGTLDERTAATAGKLARTYAILFDTLNRGRGKGRSTRQRITVTHEKHIHTHQHVHVHQGGEQTDAQPQAAGEDHDVRKVAQRARQSPGRPALPGQDPIGEVVSLAGRKRKAGL